ncbi:MAG: tyrosine--tRNA ligase [Patescibacteria group bacterium]|nr:tyrosine--tRNA ligase [Patescibacteria group bacterium]
MNTDLIKIDELLTRSVDSIYPSKEAFKDVLLSGKKISVYVGIDPTADYVHLGHSTNYLLLERLHKLGHKITVLVGDFTAMIGDPTDKMATRIVLTKDQVTKNLATFKSQIGKILDFENKENPIEFRFNSEWLSKLTFEKIIDIASNFTVQQMLQRDMFEKRISENKPLFVHEFFYPLMQGYDSVVLMVDLEIGGTDQTFNMLAGRTLVRRYLNREKFVLTTTLLVNPITGEKMMSKSLGTGVGLNETANNMFGKIMALPDSGIIQVFIDCTRLSMNDIGKNKRRLDTGENPRNIKIELAKEIVSMYHSKEMAEKAEEDFENTFKKGGIPEDTKEISVNKNETLSKVLIEQGLVKSKGELRRLIGEGAVGEVGGETITDFEYLINKNLTLKIGKRRFIKISLI